MALEPSVSSSRDKNGWNFRPSDYFEDFNSEKLQKPRQDNFKASQKKERIFGQRAHLKHGNTVQGTRRFVLSSPPEFSEVIHRDSESVLKLPLKSPVDPAQSTSCLAPRARGRESGEKQSSYSTSRIHERGNVIINPEVNPFLKRAIPSKHSHKSPSVNGARQSNESLSRGSEVEVDRVGPVRTPGNKHLFKAATEPMPWRKHSGDHTPTDDPLVRKNADSHNGFPRPKRLSRDMPILTAVSSTPQATTPLFTLSPLPPARRSSPCHTAPSPHTPSPMSPRPHTIHKPRSSILYPDLVDTTVQFTDPKTRTGSTGVICRVSSERVATVRKDSSGRLLEIPCSDLFNIPPKEDDKVKVVVTNNKNLQGRIGRLLSITGDSGVVRLAKYNGETERTLAQIKLRHLAKYVKSSELLSPNKSSAATLSKPSTTSASSNVWGSAVLKGGATFPFAPFAVPGLLPQSSPPNYPVYNPIILSSAGTSTLPPSFVHSPQPTMFASAVPSPPTVDTGRHRSNTGPFKMLEPPLPRSFQLAPGLTKFKPPSDALLFCNPVARGGNSDRVPARVKPLNTLEDVPDKIEQLLKHQKNYRVKLEDDGNTDVKTSSVRVSLVCPISQKRFKYPSRGDHCKHLQCFDAEAYIMTNINQKLKARVKQANGRPVMHPISNKQWHCPICLKPLPERELYIDRSLMEVVSEQPDSIMEVVQTERGGWTPHIKEEIEVIDLTLDDD